jgi:hypothetical protein
MNNSERTEINVFVFRSRFKHRIINSGKKLLNLVIVKTDIVLEFVRLIINSSISRLQEKLFHASMRVSGGNSSRRLITRE